MGLLGKRYGYCYTIECGHVDAAPAAALPVSIVDTPATLQRLINCCVMLLFIRCSVIASFVLVSVVVVLFPFGICRHLTLVVTTLQRSSRGQRSVHNVALWCHLQGGDIWYHLQQSSL